MDLAANSPHGLARWGEDWHGKPWCGTVRRGMDEKWSLSGHFSFSEVTL